MEIDNRQLAVTAVQQGDGHLTIILAVYSLIGGLLTSLSKTIEPYINKVTTETFLRRATRKLYL
jgi:hypothetical protein